MVTDRRLYVGASAAADADEQACATLVSGRGGVGPRGRQSRASPGAGARRSLACWHSPRACGKRSPRPAPGCSSTTESTSRWPPAPTACTCLAVRCRAPRSARSCPTAFSSAVPSTAPARRSTPSATVAATTLCLVRCSNRPSKPAGHAVAGLDALARVCASVRLPVLAIGGVTAARVPDIVRAGAAGIAAIGLFATGGEGELRDTVGQIRLAFGVSPV